jgi:hypothetical protein
MLPYLVLDSHQLVAVPLGMERRILCSSVAHSLRVAHRSNECFWSTRVVLNMFQVRLGNRSVNSHLPFCLRRMRVANYKVSYFHFAFSSTRFSYILEQDDRNTQLYVLRRCCCNPMRHYMK